MKILLIEDDNFKRNHILSFLRSAFPDSSISSRLSYHSGLDELFESEYDLLILDMSLPNYDITAIESGGPFSNFAGEEILDEMDRKSIEVPTIILTQFDAFGEGSEYVTLDELSLRLEKYYSSNFIGAIYYSSTETSWQSELETIIKGMEL